jgi:two-component system CheB/CheR fusion protein
LQVTAAELSGRTGELMSVLETAPLAIMVLDTALQISQATNAAADLFSLARPVSNPHISQCILPENFPSLAPICNETLKLGESITREFNSGGSRYKLTSSPFFDMRGQMKGVTMVVSEFPGLAQELDLILDHGQIFMLNRAKDGTILRISEKCAKFYGTTRKKAEGANFFKLVSRKIAKDTRQRDAKLMATKDSHMRELVCQKSMENGDEIWLNEENFLFYDPAAEEPSFYTIGQDVSEVVETRTRSEDALAQLVLLQNFAKVGYWSVDLEDGSVFWSREVYRIHGKNPEDFEPDLTSGIDFYHPDDREKVRKEVNRVRKNGGEFHFKLRIVTDKGKIVPIESFGMGRKGGNGKVERIIGVFRALD